MSQGARIPVASSVKQGGGAGFIARYTDPDRDAHTVPQLIHEIIEIRRASVI